MNETLFRIHNVDIDAVRLGDFGKRGKPRIYLCKYEKQRFVFTLRFPCAFFNILLLIKASSCHERKDKNKDKI